MGRGLNGVRKTGRCGMGGAVGAAESGEPVWFRGRLQQLGTTSRGWQGLTPTRPFGCHAALLPPTPPPASHVLTLPCPSPPAPPVKGKRKQSEEGEPLDPPVSPQPDGEPRSRSPVHLEVSWATPPPLGASFLPLTLPHLCAASQVTWRRPGDVFPNPPNPKRVQRGAQPHCLGP